MKKLWILAILALAGKVTAQQGERVITTAVPFLTIASDARASSMGDIGVATGADAFSQQWNPAKFAFAERKMGVGISYTPYLESIITDIALLNGSYYNKINERSAFAVSIRYFTLGEIELRNTFQEDGTLVKPNELSLDGSYALKLSDQFSMAVAGRFISSNLEIPQLGNAVQSGNTFAVDVAGYYRGPEKAFEKFDGRWRAGFNLSNLGGKIRYDDGGQENFLPTNLALGAGFDMIFDADNVLGFTGEINKLMVPTPQDYNGDGQLDDQDYQEYQSIGFFEGVFKSLGDAPDGFSEELKEMTWALGAEYSYREQFMLRAGYFNESEEKGFRKFFSLGAGFRYNNVQIDLSYLFSTAQVRNPLENTLRFSLSFNLGEPFYND
ncbi:type IX secretion system outer membrane channel protein PorV [Robiginitalea sp. M366]|uniref:type IX secretion system outer membrane channel protein PorV n=1 Tax=Robiginitalea aestuariiviva TaxID=3036903 RepID=UPI00240E0B04|nr:type IX secretion system outer membrane channel protein PorV [Robiginitalea aestuariiviva]MDG1572051.1 type IX secretion system outer membrane channel protein PorV [Robiginitalea aestuariiviva]